MGREREAALRRLRTILEEAPISALKARRKEAGMSQVEVAEEAGLRQTFYSEVETGKRPLTPKMARRIAAALKMDSGQLEVEHAMGGVRGLIEAAPEELTAERLTQLIRWLDGRLPDNPEAEDLVDALLALLEERVRAYREQRQQERQTQVATKSERKRPDRDAFGRRRNKPGRPGL